MSTIQAKNMTVQCDQKTIIKELSLNLVTQKMTTIIGANGCGKSTLLKVLTRILPLASGSVLIDGQDISSLPTKEIAKKLALLPQSQEASPGINVYELVSYGRYPHLNHMGHLSQEDHRIINWALSMTKLTDFADHCVDALSGGQKQRVWIAMALAQDTDTIFLDEPTTYLDLNHQLEVLDLLKELQVTSHKTIIMVLHDLNLSARYSDYMIAMKDGKIINQGSVSEIMTPRNIENIFAIDAQIVEDPIHHCPIMLTYQLI